MQQPGRNVGRRTVVARSNCSRMGVESKLNRTCDDRRLIYCFFSLFHREGGGGGDAESIQRQTAPANMASSGNRTTPEMENASSSSSTSCGGVAIALSGDYVYAPVGGNLVLHCRVVGTARIYWILPGRKVNEQSVLMCPVLF